MSEDDDGELATETLDAEISATLQALRSKDPRVYDASATFYEPIEEETEDASTAAGKKSKPMTLKDYHTKNLLEGRVEGVDESEDAPPLTFAQEQEEMRKHLVKQMHASGDDDEEDDDDFLVAKPKPEPPQKEPTKKITKEDVQEADKDPETFLSNFMASRAWVPTDRTVFQPLESDDEDEEARAEEFEAAYNRYFEDNAGANERLVTYARDAVASTTVRRDEKSGRKKARELAREKREAERREREAELARLRKLKIEEMEEKVKAIRKIGGFSGRDFKIQHWTKVLEEDWSDEQWDKEMRKRFGDAYYDDVDGVEDSGSDEDNARKSKGKLKKPKFDDDIDIKDLIPDFDDDEMERPAFASTDDEEEDIDASDEDGKRGSSTKTTKKRKQERAEAKSAARRDRRLIESLVDSNLEYEAALAAKAQKPSHFRYRETSPTTFGLTARDILLASDAQLNEFAGLKKLATFREPEKKKKDKKHLSKKARLRQWRTDTFGDPDGPKGGFEVLLGDEAGAADAGGEVDVDEDEALVDIREGKKKKKRRSRKRKAGDAEI